MRRDLVPSPPAALAFHVFGRPQTSADTHEFRAGKTILPSSSKPFVSRQLLDDIDSIQESIAAQWNWIHVERQMLAVTCDHAPIRTSVRIEEMDDTFCVEEHDGIARFPARCPAIDA